VLKSFVPAKEHEGPKSSHFFAVFGYLMHRVFRELTSRFRNIHDALRRIIDGLESLGVLLVKQHLETICFSPVRYSHFSGDGRRRRQTVVVLKSPHLALGRSHIVDFQLCLPSLSST